MDSKDKEQLVQCTTKKTVCNTPLQVRFMEKHKQTDNNKRVHNSQLHNSSIELSCDENDKEHK